MDQDLKYQSGFGNQFTSEAMPGSLPQRGNTPQKPPHGLIAEQLTGSAFTMSRHENLRTWLYRIRPSVVHGSFEPQDSGLLCSAGVHQGHFTPNQLRWRPLEFESQPQDWLQSLTTIAMNGSCLAQQGCGVHIYRANRPMTDKFFYNADGELLLVPEQGALIIHTELGVLAVEPQEIAVIPRGLKCQIHPSQGQARGYVCEIYGAPLGLPQLGPIGANGLALPRDFLVPEACYQQQQGSFELWAKMAGGLFKAALEHHPLDVVAWHGNYVPYKYDLRAFNTMGTVSYDHPDPSIYTVLTSPTTRPGTANVDFVIFPPRWLVGEATFRPPYFHRNIMSEYMGLVHGAYDAKQGGFVPGGGSLHNCMAAHGPDAATFERALTSDLEPEFVGDTMAFMFETSAPYQLTDFALQGGYLEQDYRKCWQGMPVTFAG